MGVEGQFKGPVSELSRCKMERGPGGCPVLQYASRWNVNISSNEGSLYMRMHLHRYIVRKKEIPYKRACEGHRVHGGYTIISLNPILGGKLTS